MAGQAVLKESIENVERDDEGQREGMFRIAGLSGGPMMPVGFELWSMQAQATADMVSTMQEASQTVMKTSQAIFIEAMRMQRAGFKMVPFWGKFG